MQGLGTDIVEISRVARAIERQRFVDRVFTSSEQVWLAAKTGTRAQSAAGLFCAKEAIAKALGTGFGKELGFCDIEIGHTDAGAPVVLRPRGSFLLSIAHCDTYATATAVYLGEGEHP